MHLGAFYVGNAPRPNQPTRPPPVPRRLTSSVHGPPFANPPRPSSSSHRRCAPASVRAFVIGRPVATRNPSCGARRNPRLGDFDAHPSSCLRAGDHISIRSPNPRFNFLLSLFHRAIQGRRLGLWCTATLGRERRRSESGAGAAMPVLQHLP
jgi:hypothetical protein